MSHWLNPHDVMICFLQVYWRSIHFQTEKWVWTLLMIFFTPMNLIDIPSSWWRHYMHRYWTDSIQLLCLWICNRWIYIKHVPMLTYFAYKNVGWSWSYHQLKSLSNTIRTFVVCRRKTHKPEEFLIESVTRDGTRVSVTQAVIEGERM